MADASGGTPAPGYRVLARKYRPRTFDDLIGQDAMVRTLSNAFDTGRIAQGYMLTGVRGVGKTTTARILARALNYAEADGSGQPTIHLPGLGLHCQAIIEGRHVDVQEMDAASHTSINDIREIIEAARYKVYIIDEVHMLSTAAFNGLLKTLEEPPEHVKFIFATTEIRKVPVTVLSRCQRFDLRRVEGRILANHLLKIAAAEGIALADDAAVLVARAAEGSVRDALSILDQAIAHGSGAVEAESLRGMLGLADRARIYDLLEAIMRGDARTALDLFGDLYAEGADPGIVVAELAEAVHATTRTKYAPQAAVDAGLPEVEAKRASEFAQKLHIRVLSRAWQMLLKGHGEVASAPRPASAAEMLIVRLCHVADMPTPDELIRKLDGVDAAPGPSQRPSGPSGGGGASSLATQPRVVARTLDPQPLAQRTAPQPTASAAPMAATVTFASFADLVAHAALKRDIPLKIALERQVRLVSFERGRLDISLMPGAPPTLVGEIQKRLSEWSGERWMVAVSQQEGGPTLAEEADRRQRSLVDDVRSEPAVAAVLARFPGAEIVAVRHLDDQPGDEIPPPAEYDGPDFAFDEEN